MSDLLYAHIAGQTVIQTLIKDGKCIFSKRTIEELEAENPGIEIGDDEWLDQRLAEASKKEYLSKPWVEIDSDEFYEAFHLLPPIKERYFAEYFCFSISEPIYRGVYTHFIEVASEDKPRFFKAPRLFKSWWSDLIKELKEQRTAH